MTNQEKYVQSKLDVNTYLKLSEYATLHSLSLGNTVNRAIKEFLNKENNKNDNKKVI